MPRVKALTTGSVPSFLDLILNFAESDTSSSLATQDTWLAQIRANGGKLVFYGDDTWLKLFPGDFFARSDGTSSFFVSDFTEVDNNVTRHVPEELTRDDWNAMIMHYLGLDHIGHKTGPQGPNMPPKQREMDGIVRTIFESMQSERHHRNTLLVLAGDHGMNAGGNHGGSGPGETEPALLFASPKFKTMQRRIKYDCPTLPKHGTEFHFYTKLEQSDIVPALASMMAMPISKNSLGILPAELAGLWEKDHELQLLQQNARQILHVIRAKYGIDLFDEGVEHQYTMLGNEEYPCPPPKGDRERLELEWAQVLLSLHRHSTSDSTRVLLYDFLRHAQEAMSDTASSYDISRMITGIITIAVALLSAIVSFPSLWPPSYTGLFFGSVCTVYGLMMFASSYVEEEQHFWYWFTPAWFLLLTARAATRTTDTGPKPKAVAASFVLFLTHRVAVRWNQTGQKHAGEPDIVHHIFPDHHIAMWVLVLLMYVVNVIFLHKRTFAGIMASEVAIVAPSMLLVLAVVFKLNFTQADAPELVQGLGTIIRQYSEPFSLVEQARAVFALMAISAIVVTVLTISRTRTRSSVESATTEVPLSERLHHLLTLFLITQSRAPNIPLFMALELQRMSLDELLSEHVESSQPRSSRGLSVAITTLLLSHVYYFCVGGSNSISSIDLSNAYNGVADYNIAAVGVLLFASNWTGPIWWCSAAVQLMQAHPNTQPSSRLRAEPKEQRDWVMVERAKLHEDALSSLPSKDEPVSNGAGVLTDAAFVYICSMTVFVSASLLAVMAACTTLRTHLFIWTVFSPKYLYTMAWSVGWHLILNIGLMSMLHVICAIQ